MQSLYPDAIGVGEISRLSTLLADTATAVPLDTPVPTCGDWTMADLVWHLTEVQDFWSYIIATRPSGPTYYEQPKRAKDQRLVVNLRNASAGLSDALRTAPPTDTAWSWSEEQTVGFTLRRQTHEALTHTVDAALAAGLALPEVSSELAADGVDEVVHVMLNGLDDAETGSVTLRSTDTDDRWTIRVGSGEAVVTGTALNLNLWLWGRGKTWPLSVTGATDQAGTLRALIADRTQ